MHPPAGGIARLLFALTALFAVPASAQVEITYLGNEGLLLRSSDAGVLIDALHAPYKDYATPPPALRAKLERAERPYDVDLLLVSHVHGDHFDAAMVASHLERSAKSRLVSSEQVVNSVLEHLTPIPHAANRVEAVTPAPGTARVARGSAKLKVTVLGLPHGGRAWSEIQNLGHIIELGGVRILHVGDADSDPALFAKFDLVNKRIDVALLPDWYLAYPEGQRLVRDHIRPRHLFAVHVMDSSAAEVAPRILRAFPNAVVLTKIGTAATISPK